MEALKQNKKISGKAIRRSMLSVMVLSMASLAAVPSFAQTAPAKPATPVTPAAPAGDLGVNDPFAITPTPATQPSTTFADGLDVGGNVVLQVGKSRKLNTINKIKEAHVLTPEVADVVPLDSKSLAIVAKKVGLTQLIVKDENDRTEMIDVLVESDIAQLRRELKDLFPGSQISVSAVNGQITLRGQVKNLQTAGDVEKVATPYGAKVVNLLEVAGGQQVMLKVRFAELNKTAEKQLGFNFGATDGTSFVGTNLGNSPFNGNALIPGALASPNGLSSQIFGQGEIGSVAFQYFINALEKDNLLRMLAEPDLVTTSGEKATFLAGGEFPVPVPQSGTGGSAVVTIDYKKFGVQLNFTPIVLGDGRIRLEVNPDVSELDFSTATEVAGTSVPGLTERSVNTTVELGLGQTFAIAGLLQNQITASNSELPGLGEIPILGSLFRSVD